MSQEQPITPNPVSAPASNRQRKKWVDRVSEWNAGYPILSIVLVSLLAVIINCYPIIFCGKSFVSPTTEHMMVYDGWPPLPGMESWRQPIPQNNHGSDVGATMWWAVPMVFVESRSVLEHGELPLWNRYGHAGETLIGQAVSMLGDPLHLIVIFGYGSALAWDLKFLAAKFLFCLGFGLLVRRLLNSQPLSLIFAALAAYCGANFYIYNHPAFFVFAYAPWILLATLELLDFNSTRHLCWGPVWLVANIACFNAGHVEVAAVLIGGLNLAAMIGALIGARSVSRAVRLLGRMGIATLFFLGLTAPVWLSFLGSLNGSYSVHEKITVDQLPPANLPGVFDDLFYRLLVKNNLLALAPGSSLLILAGCIFSGLHWRQLKPHLFFWVNSGAIAIWGGCIFGWVPASLLAMVPLLNRVGHNYVDFSYLLIIHLTIQAAYGFKCLAKVALRQMIVDVVCFLIVFVGLFVLYFCGEAHQSIPWNYFFCAGIGAIGAPLLFVFLKCRQQQNLMLGWVGILICGFIPNFRFGLYANDEANDMLLMLPGPRIILNAPSAAFNQIKLDHAEPFRVVGLGCNVMGDYPAVYELEDIRSSAPLSNENFINLIGDFPGIKFNKYWEFQIDDPIRAQPLLNLLNVKYLLARPDVSLAEKPGFRLTDRSDFDVIENLQVWPRAFFASQIMSIASSEDFIKLLLENGRQPFVALTPQEIQSHPGLQSLTATSQAIISPATHYRLDVNSTAFDVHAASAGVVCLTEGQANDFTATANHEPKKVLTVNRAFKGIYLDQPGDYHIEFTYRPRHWRLACTLFWISTGGIVMVMLISVRAYQRLNMLNIK